MPISKTFYEIDQIFWDYGPAIWLKGCGTCSAPVLFLQRMNMDVVLEDEM